MDLIMIQVQQRYEGLRNDRERGLLKLLWLWLPVGHQDAECRISWSLSLRMMQTDVRGPTILRGPRGLKWPEYYIVRLVNSGAVGALFRYYGSAAQECSRVNQEQLR